MAAVYRCLISYSARIQSRPLLASRRVQSLRAFSTADAIYPQTDVEQINVLSSHLSSGQVSETIMKLLQWRYHDVAISDAVYRHVIFSSAHFDRPTMEALCSFITKPDRETALLLQLITSSNAWIDVLRSAPQWSSSLLCKAIEIASENCNSAAIGILQPILLCRADFKALERAAPHIIHGRLSTDTHSQLRSLLDQIRAYEIPLKAPAFANVFNIDRLGSSLTDIFDVFEECIACSLCPDAQIFTDLLHTVIRSSAHQKTIRHLTKRLLRNVNRSCLKVDIGLILKACARGAMPAEGLLQIFNSGQTFQPRYAVLLVKACANIHDRKIALFHLRAVESALHHYKVQFTTKQYRALLHVYAEFGRDRLETTIALSQLLPDLHPKDLTARLRVCHNNIEEALMLLPRGNDLGECRPTTDHFRFALLTMAKTKSYDLALRLLDLFNDMRKKSEFSRPPDGSTLSTIYTLVLRSADDDDFEQFLRRFLHEDKIAPDSITLIAVYEYCAGKDLDHWHRTNYLLQELKSRVRVDGAVCSFAVRLLLSLGLLEEAVNLISESERHQPDRNRVHPATYRILLKALVKAEDGAHAKLVLEMQKNDGLKIRPSHLQLVHSLTKS